MKRRFYIAGMGLALYVRYGSAHAEGPGPRVPTSVFPSAAPESESAPPQSAPASPPAPAPASAPPPESTPRPPKAARDNAGDSNEERDWSTLPQTAYGGSPRSIYISAFYVGLAAGPVSTKGHAPMRAGFAGELTLGLAFWKEVPLTVGVGAANLGDPLARRSAFEPCDVEGTCTDTHDPSSRILGQYFTVNTGYQHRFQAWPVVYFVPGLLLGYQVSVNPLHASPTCNDCPDEELPVPNASLNGLFLAPTIRASFGRNGGFIAISVRSQWFLVGDLLQTTLFGMEFIAP